MQNNYPANSCINIKIQKDFLFFDQLETFLVSGHERAL